MKKLTTLILLITLIFAAPPAGYYDSADGLSGTALKAALHDIIDGHTEKSYDFLWTGLKYTDEDPDNSNNFVLLYTGRSLSKSSSYPAWNREHTWAKSHGDFGNDPPCGTDMHHLRPTDVSVNSDRGNKDFDNGGTLHSEATECRYDSDSWEPRDAVKGDVARSMLYMTVRYEGDSGEPDLELVDYTGTSGPNFGKLSTLLAWHVQDPVDDWERRRNDRVYSYQNNRNPFIDHPEYVAYIWEGETPEELQAPLAVSATNVDSTSFTANWNAVDGATGYELYVGEDMVFLNRLDGYYPLDISGTSAMVSGLTPDNNYYYKVKAYNDDSESEFSNFVIVKTLEGNGGTVNPPDTGDTHIETFANFSETGSSYVSGSFTGQDGSTWAYVNCRGDSPGQIDGSNPCLGKDRSPESSITSGTISNGISTLSFEYKQAFSTSVSLDVYVNDNRVHTVTTSSEQGTIKESGTINVNVSGDVVIRFVQSSSASGQVGIDNVSWTSMPVSIEPALPVSFVIGNTYPNPFNPVALLPLELSQEAYVKVSMYDLLGNERQILHDGLMMAGQHELTISGEGLATGVYLLRIIHNSEISTKKIVLLK